MSEATDRMNALARMSPADRDEAILRAAFGPMFGQFAAYFPPPVDLRAERIRREREASERRFEQRHGRSSTDPTGPEAA